MTQVPLLHVADALVNVQAVVHEPQCAGSVFRFASHPSVNVPLQLPKPVGHVAATHVPAEQA
jgi:hypothetical protein